jgi:hypothetical protein
MENEMSFVIVSDIRRARHKLRQMSVPDRRRLVRNIVEALEMLADSGSAERIFQDRRGLDRIIFSTSVAVGEIAGLDDEQFEILIAEFDVLFAKVSQAMLIGEMPASFELH